MLNYAGYKEWKEDYDKQQEEIKKSKNSLFEQIQINKRKADNELVIKKKKGNTYVLINENITFQSTGLEFSSFSHDRKHSLDSYIFL